MRAILAALAAATLIATPALAQRAVVEEPPVALRRLQPVGESEADSNTMTFLLGQGYAVAAVTEHEIVLHKGTRIYFCPIARFRSGGGGPERVLLTSMCALLHDPAQALSP